MSKKYLNLDEAAQMLSLAPEELVRLRERGDVRGFADRGTWKFKSEDIETLLRRRQADSNPEVPLIDPDNPAPSTSRSSKVDLGEQPTIIRRDRPAEEEHLLSTESDHPHTDSDSDVRLVRGDMDLDFDIEGDSDVKLAGLRNTNQNNVGTDPEIVINQPGSDSDVRLVRAESDSDIKLTADSSDSDVQLVGDATEMEVSLKPQEREGGTDHDLVQKTGVEKQGSDSDVKLVPSDSSAISDVTLMDDEDDAISIVFNPENSRQASVLDDESGISLGHDSSLLLGESGISLAGPSDSGINLELDDDAGLTLALDDESGISLDPGESGISLEGVDSGISLESAESGISLEGDDRGGTVPMMDIFADEDAGFADVAQAEDGSEFDMMSGGATGEMEALDDSASDAIFDLDEEFDEDAAPVDSFDDEDMDLEAESFEDGDLDVFDADEAAFEDAGTEGLSGAPVGRMRATEAEWDTATFVGLTIGSLLLIVCGIVMIDLVKNTATAATPTPIAGQVLELLGGLYK